MFKNGIIRRITISTIALLIFLITYLFPTKIQTNELKQTLTYQDVQKEAIYLIDEENFVSRVDIMLKSQDPLDKIREILAILTLKSQESEYIPTPFSAIIPENTKINNLTLEDGLLKIDFSKEFLNTTIEHERKLIESVVYSLTELEEVQNILIFVDGVQFTELPFSKEKLPTILNKDFGVNKIYEIDSIKDTKKTTIYYGSKAKDVFYYVPITYVSNTNQEKVEIIIEKLKSSPLYESKLISYLNANTEITDYQIKENEIKLSFNKYLLDDLENSNILEEVQYTIFLSLRDTYDIKSVEFTVQNENKNVNLVINSLE